MTLIDTFEKRPLASYMAVAVIAFAVIFTARAGCGSMVDDSRAVETAEKMGFSDLRVVDRSNALAPFLGCGNEDMTMITLTGTNSAGAAVEFSMCCGWPFKGCTFRD